MNRDIIFMGCRGYTKKYGGWETFIQNLIKNWNDNETRFFVVELVYSKEEEGYEVVDNVNCIRIYSKLKGKPELLVTGVKFLFQYGAIVKKFNIKKPILYVMGSHVGVIFPFLKYQFKKTNTRIVHNPAGMEWKRKKYNFIMRKYSYLSRMIFIRTSVDCLVSDNPGVFRFYKDKFKRSAKKQNYIAYGTYKAPIISDEMPKNVSNYFNEFGIRPREYYLVLGRCVPENNYELILREFLNSNTKKDLIIICNNNYENKYFQKLRTTIPFEKDSRVKFIGTCYDSEILNYVRQLATAYIHGHSVGGTNPGLLEAMSATNVNILYDVVFNREVGKDCALYFGNDDNSKSLREVISYVDVLCDEERKELGIRAKERMLSQYSWAKIVCEYKTLFQTL